ncbi:hypothetical protein SERLA73DRAFT_186647 [Serpula lacrymans var. lacrymans S7.3]|uniref:Uncharacterized protein n=2 Tax=Serpula lacrymans var. lacrymans TaxID=341189 RepID=F8Q7M6_SERL3|nr:uncharacterized protein SERLADRAFT_475807 [Serpula lacrymans var. lacrymans S7.9]EGN95564.1 hypothetical protein SERLA73DRAFT_186647 [Serpula lacrymans var. lacrymans S7.3]EGO21092.1 hypothetical protein SERLADRAFT_475807 [Serpula lacrymans var. lacrymans S7.9]
MMRKVRTNEGWIGFVPSLAFATVMTMAGLDMTSFLEYLEWQRWDTLGCLYILLFAAIKVMIYVVAAVIENRAINTRFTLPTFSPRYALFVLLTPAECARPRLLFAPGLILAQALSMAYIVTAFAFRGFLVRLVELRQRQSGDTVSIVLFIALYIVTLVCDTMILSPLEVATVRLALQRSTSEELSPVVVPSDGAPDKAGDEVKGGLARLVLQLTYITRS